MTSDGDALLRAICEHPFDDTPRLAYADWLEENGRPERAEFIRVQIELARLPERERWDSALRKRSKELEAELDRLSRSGARLNQASPWWHDLPHPEGVCWCIHTERGFGHDVIFSDIGAVRAHAEAVFAASPISNVEVEGMTAKAVAELVARPWLGRVRQLVLKGPIRDEGLAVLLAAGPFPRLEGLWVDTGRITDAGAAMLARTKSLPNLRTITLLDNKITARGVAVLCRSKTLPRLVGVNGLGEAAKREVMEGRNPDRFAKRFPESWWTC
jgi:uncharacterized protein (TIGR02996 family)